MFLTIEIYLEKGLGVSEEGVSNFSIEKMLPYIDCFKY